MKSTASYIDLTACTRSFLPDVETRVTQAVWSQIAGNDPFDPQDDRSRDLAMYAAFAAIGLIGRERLRTNGCETTTIPVAFESKDIEVLVTIRYGASEPPRITISLAGEVGNLRSRLVQPNGLGDFLPDRGGGKL